MAPRTKAPKRKAPKRKVRSTVVMNRALNPIPQRYICTMKYATTVVTDLGGNYIMRLNSLYDPDQTGGGHQPYGYNTLESLYNRYRVINTSWRIQVPKTNEIVQVGCLPGNGLGAGFSNFSLLKETPRTRYFTQQPGGQCLTLSGGVGIASIVGRTKSQYMADDRYQALVTSNPSEDADLVIMVANVLDVAQPNVAINIIMEFTAEFFDVKQQVQS